MLPLLAAQIGLTRGLEDGWGSTRQRRYGHPPGQCFDLVVMLRNGGRCVFRPRCFGRAGRLFGDGASVSTARAAMVAIGEHELHAIRFARAGAPTAA
jgi:hypothetical protein